jgi:hypothetical protein
MNRRLFIAFQPLMLNNNTNNKMVKPVNSKSNDNDDGIFVSQNRKLVIHREIIDYGSTVTVQTATVWDDPISNESITKYDKQLYILETDNM